MALQQEIIWSLFHYHKLVAEPEITRFVNPLTPFAFVKDTILTPALVTRAPTLSVTSWLNIT